MWFDRWFSRRPVADAEQKRDAELVRPGANLSSGGLFQWASPGKLGPDYRPVIFSNFIAFQYYWTSTTDAADATQAWTIFSCDFGVYNMVKTDTSQYALAVR